MKKHLAYGALLAAVISLSTSCSSLTLKAKGNRPINTQPKATTQAVLPSIQTIPGKTPHPFIRFLKRYKGRLLSLLGLLWLWILARLNYLNEKRYQFARWQFDDLALLKAIKDNALRLWSTHRPDRKVIRLEEWKSESKKLNQDFLIFLNYFNHNGYF